MFLRRQNKVIVPRDPGPSALKHLHTPLINSPQWSFFFKSFFLSSSHSSSISSISLYPQRRRPTQGTAKRSSGGTARRLSAVDAPGHPPEFLCV